MPIDIGRTIGLLLELCKVPYMRWNDLILQTPVNRFTPRSYMHVSVVRSQLMHKSARVILNRVLQPSCSDTLDVSEDSSDVEVSTHDRNHTRESKTPSAW